MLNRIFTIMLTGILLLSVLGFRSVRAETEREGLSVEKVRAGILKMGVGRAARVEVRLRNDTKLKGYISEAGEDTFTVTDLKTGTPRAVAYADVAEVKKATGGGLSLRTKVIIGAAAAVGAGIVLYVVRGAFCDGQC